MVLSVLHDHLESFLCSDLSEYEIVNSTDVIQSLRNEHCLANQILFFDDFVQDSDGWYTFDSANRFDDIIKFLSFGDSQTTDSVSGQVSVATHHDVSNTSQSKHSHWVCAKVLDKELDFLNSSGNKRCHRVAAESEAIHES